MTRERVRIRGLPLLAGVLLAGVLLALGGCGPRYERLAVTNAGGVKVTLRSERRGGEDVDRGFAQPATISGVRLAHILATVDVRLVDEDNVRRPAVPAQLVYDVGEAVSKALAKANSSQEVVVQAVRTERRLGVFTDKFMTGLILWVEGDSLMLHVTHVDARVTRGPKQEKMPEPWLASGARSFKVVPAAHMTVLGPKSLAVDWRDPSFRRATALSIGPGGAVRRRTILLEEDPSQAPPAAAAPNAIPAGLSAKALRALADLEDERRTGGITEGEYSARRRAILEGADGP